MHSLLVLLASTALMQSPDLAFAPARDGQFAFDTGVVKGLLTATADGQGITSLVDVKTGRELTQKLKERGLLSYYRFLGSDQRWADVGWKLPKSAERIADGAVRITWPAKTEHPFVLSATYRWIRPDALDVETAVKAERDLPVFEVFLSSYFADSFRCRVYLKPGRYAQGKTEPELALADVSPLTDGLYYAFARDQAAAHIIFDGRWLRGGNPVDWAVTRYLAGALAAQEDPENGVACVLMSKPEDCFAVYASYNKTPPDGVAAHHSMYLGLFGKDLKAGQTARTTSRLVIMHPFEPAPILREYETFTGRR